MMLLLIGVIVGVIIGYYFNQRIYKVEIKELSNEIDNVMSGLPGTFEKTLNEGEISILYLKIHSIYNILERNSEIMQKEKEEMKNYIADISHQLKTPITAISMYLEIMDMEVEEGSTKEQLEKCLFLIHKMQSLINNLLTLARLESNSVTFDIESYQVYDTVEQVIMRIEKSNLNEKTVINNNIPIDLYGRYDEEALIEAIFNIVKNAVIYCDKEPIITIDAMRTELLCSIFIKDNGPGIDKEQLPHIFERFYRVKSENGKSGGTGIGLAISKMMIEKIHGRIEVESGYEGTIFTIHLVELVTSKKFEP